MNYDVRQSQVVHTWPAGSLIDFPELSMIMLCHDDGINDWGKLDAQQNKRQLINDSRLAEAFKVSYFVLPPIQQGTNNLTTFGIRFPRAQYCPHCGLIHLITKDKGHQVVRNGTLDQTMSAFTCDDCTNRQTGIGPKLIPMRFVIATEEGFLDDFPWDWYVHKTCPNERNKGHKLYFNSRGGSASLADITIESKRKPDNKPIAKIDLRRIFEQEIFTEQDADGHYLNYVNGFLPKPWKGWHNNNSFVTELISDIPSSGNINTGDDLTDQAKRKFPRTLQRGAGNIIFPIIYSGILLPESTYDQQCPPEIQGYLATSIENLKAHVADPYENYMNEDWRNFFLENAKKDSHKLLSFGYSRSQIVSFIKNYFGDKTDEQFINKAMLLRQQEFKAFTGEIFDDQKVWFKKKKISGLNYNNILNQENLLDDVILLEKLSALKVYKGFTRIKPLMAEELIFADAADNLGADQLRELQRIQDARKNPMHTNELPAVEVKGEGILLKFNNQKINEWASIYPESRIKTINNNLTEANLSFSQNHPLLNKRYLLLHTLSHVLLKELSEDCGYSLSSLSEIIYCSDNDKIETEEEMNGILIYTTTTDAEGSLGGLVEKGNPEYLSAIIKKGVDKARWCSSDPLCISSEHGQGFMGLNLAACYSCILLPETSCEKMNKYLDRATIVGTLNNAEIGFFNS